MGDGDPAAFIGFFGDAAAFIAFIGDAAAFIAFIAFIVDPAAFIGEAFGDAALADPAAFGTFRPFGNHRGDPSEDEVGSTTWADPAFGAFGPFGDQGEPVEDEGDAASGPRTGDKGDAALAVGSGLNRLPQLVAGDAYLEAA